MTTSVPAPPFVPGAALRSPEGLGRATAALLGVTVAADLFAVYADMLEMNVGADLANGATGSAVLDRADHADTLYGIAGVAQGLALIATAVVYLCWLWRVRVNAEVFDQSAHRMRRGWTIGGWFCPVVNLWFPRRIVVDAWDASAPWGARVRHAPVNAWWTVWIVGLFVGRLAYTRYEHAGTGSELRGAAGLMLFSDALDAVAAILAVLVVVHLTRMQRHKALAGPLPSPAVG
ncbi:DUF4328 domain-containing protein [Streptomyces sp. NPDC052301]|uniref:DUF4328 domain-containing protein n=1 Tax=Streptomyces sp. NPDC052301 TaxID=3365687 RepID=UPI0037D84149